MSRFNERLTAGLARVKTVAAETVSIRRAEYTTEGVSAVVGNTRFEDGSVEGVTFRRRVRDYLIDVDDYQINDEAVEPQPGDEILQVLDGETRLFEVSSPGGSEPPWRYSDTERTRYRIHTRDLGAEED